MERVARLTSWQGDVRGELPGLCGAFLGQLEEVGRLGGGRVMGAYVRALSGAFEEAGSGKVKLTGCGRGRRLGGMIHVLVGVGGSIRSVVGDEGGRSADGAAPGMRKLAMDRANSNPGGGVYH